MAISLRATKTFVDVYGIERNAGDEWLIQKSLTDTHILDAYENSIEEVFVTVLAFN
jgi:hypothetical protein